MNKERMFSEDGAWYKGNLHSHTTSSDGKLTPAQAVAAYRNQGYSFLCFSEHDYYTDRRKELDCEDFIILPGIEASAYLIDSASLPGLHGLNENSYINISSSMVLELLKQGIHPKIKKAHHIHGILGTKAMQEAAVGNLFHEEEKYISRAYIDKWDGHAVAQALSDDLKKRGCFTAYDHPIWSRVEIEEVQNLTGIWAIECYNYNTLNECAEGQDTVYWDAMLRRGRKIFGFASDDNHNSGLFPDSFGGYVMVRAKSLDHESIVMNLLSGNYYFSNGAAIDQWGIRDGKVYVKCKEAERINFICGGYVGASFTILADDNVPLTYGEYTLKGSETYVRIEVVTVQHQMAWTNPVWL